ncbi:SCF E3 ubiquitin ligase complex F-box protein pof2-like [Aphidius gifuensis]|uniref:SCF E3 ubiquitin ligase complex F-box protein pof2-like n=1 Tax=Aphidius gifuensis TaxID=684658 RepID=UPI001CDC011A|nr:SCF E3 ubiquitin ligase complex F-box protein pof2-like [Aphidius gifuensis]
MSCKNISNVVLRDIGQLKELECLILLDGKNVDDNVIISISNNCNKLKHFELSYCKDATASALCQLAKLENLERLTLLSVENFDNNAITRIVSKCKNIKSLNLFTCYKLTEIGLQSIANLEHLETLHLLFLGTISDAIFNGVYKLKSLLSVKAINFTVEGLIMLLKNCPNLEDLTAFPAPFNVEVLSCAVEETCRRTNNTLLTINATIIEQSHEKFKHIASLSPLLEVIC